MSVCQNRRFKAKNFTDNMVLYKSKKAQGLDWILKKIALVLTKKENNWNAVAD